ncbi:hypothetical protein DDB_G0292424 [Dictyostelium discoideum AX4]|uniref:Biotin transporter BioY n=1 Tax=Dictyostelium discoideum TaxID=44689 RepID=Q54D94_DICDI|nr:hypothetical protein DDB_G0292424 [Dictyostelium discoideum AX4]EAL61191.1 hypothetical protein DDB_G0292424 [Dictyostelium discoideum AX4]|eukprot:XP_629602.1 hypothetical protein DDB_G0292424 [Dictyostelium discoideum AX4]
MELQILSNYYDFETLSGRKLNISQESGETVGNVKKRIASIFGNDGEIGSDGSFYLLHYGRELNDDEIVNQSLIDSSVDGDDKLRGNGSKKDNNNNGKPIQIRRNRYSCFAEHMINEHLVKPWSKWIARISCIIFSVLLIASLAQISFYLPHAKNVPVTFQTLGVFVMSSLLGWKMGCSSIILYLLCGLAGAPFFTNQNHGVTYMYGSTSGYLYGFIVASFIVGFFAEMGSDRAYIFNWKSTLFSMIFANIAIYIIGIPVLAIKIGWIKSFKLGLLPFLVGDALKIIIATIIIPSIWKFIAFLSNKRIIIKSPTIKDILSSSQLKNDKTSIELNNINSQ